MQVLLTIAGKNRCFPIRLNNMASKEPLELQQLARRTCIVVLNWNGYQDTIECLDSLLSSTIAPATIIVCDNCSEDLSPKHLLAWAESRFSHSLIGTVCSSDLKGFSPVLPVPAFVLLLNDTNLGYGGGNNSAIQFALAQEAYDFFWILNNDTIVHPEALSSLLGCASLQPHIGIFGSTVVFYNQPELIQCAGGCRYYPLSTVYRPAYGGRPLIHVNRIPDDLRLDYIYGASIFIRRKVFETIGLFNEEYFLFYEELDLCRRAQRAGYALGWCRPGIVYHKESKSIGKLSSDGKVKIIAANYFENLSTLLFTHNFHPQLLPIAMILRFLGKCFMMVKRRQWFLLKPLLAAYRDFIKRCCDEHCPTRFL